MHRLRENGIALTPFCDYPGRSAVDWRHGQSAIDLGTTSMQEEMPLQRRRYPRFPFHRMASIVYDSGECPGALLDASFNGALFEASSRLSSRLPDCVLIIPFSRDPEEAIRLQAEVAYRRGVHMGLQALPGIYFLWLALIVGAYIALTQVVKVWYIRRYNAWL